MSPAALQDFILTRRWRDAPADTEIEYWLATGDGPRKVVLTAHNSVAFVEARHREVIKAQIAAIPGLELRELDLKTFGQEPVLGVYAAPHRLLGRLGRALAAQGIPLREGANPHLTASAYRSALRQAGS